MEAESIFVFPGAFETYTILWEGKNLGDFQPLII
jgi:hypothetical protein